MDPLQTPPAAPFEPRPNWWSRNWKWVVPTGCFSIIVLILIFVFAIVLFVFGMLKSTDVYKTAVASAKNNPEVIEALGSPIKEGMLVGGKTNIEGSSGEADLSIPISGPKGKGTIYVMAKKSAGRWNFETMEVEVHQTKNRINIAPTTTLETDDESEQEE
ncbi:MAG: hypothetical protein H0V56_02690 [Chthoniobacterales bacterium]|nr:hypothetical protein [Chthoniobacterales bacterium]